MIGLQSSDGLSPRLGACVVEQREALLLQLVRCDLDGLSVRDLELDARLWHRPLHWPVRRAEACLRSLSQGPGPEGLATVDVFAVQAGSHHPPAGRPAHRVIPPLPCPGRHERDPDGGPGHAPAVSALVLGLRDHRGIPRDGLRRSTVRRPRRRPGLCRNPGHQSVPLSPPHLRH